MPNSKSAKKALRQSQKKRLHNRAQRSSLRTAVKRAESAVSGGDSDAAEKALQTAYKKLDQAADKHLIHKNKAARTKSRLARAAAQSGTESATAE